MRRLFSARRAFNCATAVTGSAVNLLFALSYLLAIVPSWQNFERVTGYECVFDCWIGTPAQYQQYEGAWPGELFTTEPSDVFRIGGMPSDGALGFVAAIATHAGTFVAVLSWGLIAPLIVWSLAALLRRHTRRSRRARVFHTGLFLLVLVAWTAVLLQMNSPLGERIEGFLNS